MQVSGHQIGDGKRDSSSSSDEQLDTSDELDKINRMVITNNDVNEFITEVAANAERSHQQQPTTEDTAGGRTTVYQS